MRVLLADDQVWLRSALRFILENQATMKVVGETSSVSTLPNLVAELTPDLLFLDWQLAGLTSNGARLKTVRDVRLAKPNLCIIAITDDNDQWGCVRLGANAQINRAEAPDHLLSIVNQAIQHTSIPYQTPIADYRGHLIV